MLRSPLSLFFVFFLSSHYDFITELSNVSQFNILDNVSNKHQQKSFRCPDGHEIIHLHYIVNRHGRDATPYLERNRVGRDAIDSAAALTDMGKYLFRERRLPVYDIAVAITNKLEPQIELDRNLRR
ncbi:CLUMA_CG001289, isoform A [Clunio marinus]|uniref:CLUMA_CG001289, isoform A n=1 Tax=Clunio marinus TaxID=568069 RepID=A0A1J1HHH9_9DIPT|nr:CLUMA_CG001289, isoform A [Clunio marinus]